MTSQRSTSAPYEARPYSEVEVEAETEVTAAKVYDAHDTRDTELACEQRVIGSDYTTAADVVISMPAAT